MRQTSVRLCAVLISAGLCGCSAFNGVPNGEPNFDIGILLPPTMHDTVYSVAAQTMFSPPPIRMTQPEECQTAFGPPPSAATVATAQIYRDECVKELMDLIDFEYNEYKKSFRQAVDDSNLGADLAVLGLGTAGALTPGTVTKSILSGTAAAVTGAKTSINADVLYNSSILVVINQMDTDRQNEKCLILSQLDNPPPSTAPATTPVTLTLNTTTTVKSSNTSAPKLQPQSSTNSVKVSPTKTYSMVDASNDLIQYYQAGTFTHALQSLQAKTGAQAVAAKQQVNNQKTGNTPTGAVAGAPAAASGSQTQSASSPNACSS
jgi:hypothetical protein